MLRGVNHPSEATESPIEIQLSTLRTTLGDDLVRDLEDSVAPNTWRAYRSDLADFATWVAYTSAEWKAPEVVATYLRTLEDGGAAYATITRRLTSIHKLVAIAAIAAGDLDYEDPTKHPRVRVTLQAIRRRLSTDQDQANPLTSQRLLPLDVRRIGQRFYQVLYLSSSGVIQYFLNAIPSKTNPATPARPKPTVNPRAPIRGATASGAKADEV